MSNLKVGMRVKAVTEYPENNFKRISVGDFGTVTGFDEYVKDFVHVHFDNGRREEFYDWRVEPVTEEPKQMFNIKTDPWFIRVNSKQEFEVIQDWLQENYGCSLITSYNTAFEYLTNTSCTGQIEEAFVMHGRGNPLETTSRKEIRFTFKTTIDSVTFPEVESEQQIKMKQLQETIDKAARELKELREMGEKK